MNSQVEVEVKGRNKLVGGLQTVKFAVPSG